MATLTDGRTAVWNAILNHTDLKENNASVFKRRLKFDQEETFIKQDAIEDNLSFSDLPAIAIWNSNVSFAWNRNSDQEWLDTILVTIWTPNHKLPDAEDYAEKVLVAIFEQTAPGITNPCTTYVKQATGHHPVGAGNITFEPVNLGVDATIKAVRTTFNLQLRFWKSILPSS